jgi:hypothetical protein
MAIYFRGMTDQETTDLTLAMAASGDQLDLHDIFEDRCDHRRQTLQRRRGRQDDAGRWPHRRCLRPAGRQDERPRD